MEEGNSQATNIPNRREDTIRQILALEESCQELEAASKSYRSSRSKFANLGGRLFIRFALGARLTRAMGSFLTTVKERKGPVLGPELARTLDAASRKMIGYKRWILLFGLLAALPGTVSVVLLWEQNNAVAETKDNSIAGRKSGERLTLLATIYNTRDKTESGRLTTPLHSQQVRQDAVLRLIERDRAELLRTKERDILDTSHMVDISMAPLNGVNFSPLPGYPPTSFERVSFVNSNFDQASFHACELVRVWFDNAYLWNMDFRDAKLVDVSFIDANIRGADFTGASFYECDFKGAQFDPATKWPEGFDPAAAGATPFPESP